MYWIALTLGFFGSLHCIGMCGPLALGILSHKNGGTSISIFSSISYNLGRTIGYMILGLFFGVLGNMIALGGMQKTISITLGVIMVFFFLFSLNPDQLISKHVLLKGFYEKVSHSLSNIAQKSGKMSALNLGIINGFLPCGLVYVAIAGAISLSNIWGSMGFMMFFGLGTFPAMMAVLMSNSLISSRIRLSFRKLYPVIMLVMGAYLIYRGMMSKMPLSMNFYESLQNPVMCH